MKHIRVDGVPRWIYWSVTCVYILLAAFLRVWYLDRVPSGIVGDELDYVLNAKAIYHTGGSILTADWSPWSLTTVPGEIPKAELPYVVSIPFVGPFGLSLFTARIGYALLSIAYVVIVALTAQAFFGGWVGLAAGLIAAANPWSVYYGRTAYDVPIAITGYLAALLILAKYKGPRLLLAIIPLVIGFYSYIGTKVLFIPYTFTALLGVWLTVHKRKETLWLCLVGVFACLLFGLYVYNLKSLDTNVRLNQIFTPYHRTVTDSVDSQRRMTIASPLTRLFANKPIVYLKLATIKFFGAFSPGILFTNGEGMATFSLWEHGLFYPTDAILLIIGIGALYMHAPKILLLLGIIIGISTLPSVLSTAGTTYVHRSSLMYPLLTIIMAYGTVTAVHMSDGRFRRLLVSGCIVIAYAVLIANFAYLYFFRFPYYNSESFGLSQRIYSRYMGIANSRNIPVSNISGSSVGYYRNFLFYNNIPTQDSIPAIRTAFQSKHYIWGSSVFTDACPTKQEIAGKQTVYILSDTSPCKELFINQPMIAIPSLSDGGSLYMIFNDRVCSDYALSTYPTGFTMEDFDVEKSDVRRFCERHLIRYSQPLYMPTDKNGEYIRQR